MVLFVLCISAICLLPFLGGVQEMAIACGVGLCPLGIMSAFVWFRANIPDGYTPGLFRLFGLVSLIASTLLLFHLDIFPCAVGRFHGRAVLRSGLRPIGGHCYLRDSRRDLPTGRPTNRRRSIAGPGTRPGGDNLAARLFFVWYVPLVIWSVPSRLVQPSRCRRLGNALDPDLSPMSIEQVGSKNCAIHDAAAKQVGKHQGIRRF